MLFQVDDTVRVARLLEAERDVTGSVDVPPQPRVGDTAKIAAEDAQLAEVPGTAPGPS